MDSSRRYQHFIITRFCYAQFHEGEKISGTDPRHEDPLRPEYLEFRFKLFEIFCVPSITSQTKQNFQWIIIIDKRLSAEHRDRLNRILADIDNVIIHEYDSDVTVKYTKWIQPYLQTEPEFLVTTLHDDDDVLPEKFCATLYDKIDHALDRDQTVPCMIFGHRTSEQWDMLFSKTSPMGVKAEWPAKRMVASCGFTLMAKFPQIKLNTLDLTHNFGPNYLDLDQNPQHANVSQFRSTLQNIPEVWPLLKSSNVEQLFHDMSKDLGPTIMANHHNNSQFVRMYKKKNVIGNVTGPESFPNRHVNWEKVTEYSDSFRPNGLMKRIYLNLHVYLLKLQFLISKLVKRN